MSYFPICGEYPGRGRKQPPLAGDLLPGGRGSDYLEVVVAH